MKRNAVYLLLKIFLLCPVFAVAQQTNFPPVVTATGNQVYCPGTPINIVSSFSITDVDPGDTTAPAVYIQISEGYVYGQDQLSLSITIPNVVTAWDDLSGKFTISGVNGQLLPFATLEAAVSNVVYNNSNPNALTSATKKFSISLGDANYLPSTGHYYRYVANLGISWTAARNAAAADSYYGLQGYLATLLTAEEAQLCGEQAEGAGWIGGSDEETEGVWKWVTGPEAGTIFWYGQVNGSTPNFAFWNSNEPNDRGGVEDYAHITARNIGVPGAWNDLKNESDPPGNYQAKGYIVEYGGMPGDLPLTITASTTITASAITLVTSDSICNEGIVTLSALADNGLGTVYWYNDATGGMPFYTGNSFITPFLTQSKSYYVSAYDPSCPTAPRTEVKAMINQLPTISSDAVNVAVCGSSNPVLQATASQGSVLWYTDAAGGTSIGSGSPFNAQPITADTVFYAEAVSAAGCVSASRVAVYVKHLDAPPAIADVEVSFCEGGTAFLDATTSGIVQYVWDTPIQNQTGAVAEVNQPGIYTVNLVNAAGCSTMRTFNAIQLDGPKIAEVVVSGNTAAVIMADGETTNYTYSLNHIQYQSLPVFQDLLPGVYTVYARSANSCGEDRKTFYINLMPKMFSPNGDLVNDVFTVASIEQLPFATVNIFDRYGKFIIRLDSQNRSWDGTLNGAQLPASDYWYILKVDDATPEVKGHFSLIR